MSVKKTPDDRQRASEKVRAARIRLVGGVLAAIITGTCAIAVALINTSKSPRELIDSSSNDSSGDSTTPSETSSLLSIEGPTPVPQPVSSYTFSGGDPSKVEDLRQEITTFEFIVKNSGTSKVVLTSAAFVPKDVVNPVEGFRSNGGSVGRTTDSISAIDHKGHIAVPVGSLKVDRDIDQQLGLPIEADSSVKFGLWYQYTPTGDHDPRNVAGTLTLSFDNGETIARELTMKFRPN